jgi:long-chain acyl-CoA synthetase
VENTLSWPLDHAARLHGDRLAFAGDPPVTYRELRRRIGGLGSALERLDVARGAVAGVLAENSREHLECWLGIPTHGRVLNDLNIRLAVSELEFMLTDSGARTLFVDAAMLQTARELLTRCEHVDRLVFIGEGPCPDDCEAYAGLVALDPADAPELRADDLAAISYTGGTTGTPKGVMLSHANLIANAKHNSMVVDYRRDDVYLHSAPMFHVADASLTLAVTWAGGAHVFVPRFDAAAVSHAIEAHGVTILVMVPTMIQAWLAELARNPIDLSSVRLMIYAGSPISTELQLEALSELPFELMQGYGMTETAPSLMFLTPEDHRRGATGEEPHRKRLASVGTPLRGVQVEIRGADGAKVPDGEIGEICVRGPNVMLGYWNRVDVTVDAFVDGWYRTGDAGYADGDGYVFLVDRLKDMIVSGGENVYSVEVERALLSHSAVIEAAVFGVPDPRWGEAVHAVVVVGEGSAVSADELIAHCREQVAGYKTPRTLEVRASPLPKSGAGKILKHELRAPFWRGQARNVGGSAATG